MGLTDGETGSCSDGWAILSKSLIQFSVDGQGYFLPVVGPDTKDGGGHGPPSKGPVQALLRSVPQLCSRPPPTHVSAGDSWTLTAKSGSVSCGVTAPFF